VDCTLAHHKCQLLSAGIHNLNQIKRLVIKIKLRLAGNFRGTFGIISFTFFVSDPRITPPPFL